MNITNNFVFVKGIHNMENAHYTNNFAFVKGIHNMTILCRKTAKGAWSDHFFDHLWILIKRGILQSVLGINREILTFKKCEIEHYGPYAPNKQKTVDQA